METKVTPVARVRGGEGVRGDQGRVTIIGMDPGLVATGYGIVTVEGKGVFPVTGGAFFLAEAGASLEARLEALYRGLREVLEGFRPQAMALEEIYSHYAHPQTAIRMAHARGVIVLAAGEQGIPLYHYSATRVKSSLTGNGRASKAQVQRAVQQRLGLAALPSPDHVADALALALCHAAAMASPLAIPSRRAGPFRTHDLLPRR